MKKTCLFRACGNVNSPLPPGKGRGVGEGFERPRKLNRHKNTVFFLVFCVASTLSWACTPDLGGAKAGGIHKAESKNYAIMFRTLPEKIVMGQHFAVEFALCANAGAALPESVRVDAHMPDHRHGMNYKTVVNGNGPLRYRAEGLMFHMPGRWAYVFEVRSAGETERITTSVTLQ